MIDSDSALYCIFGDPVSHSKSPLMHNYLFRRHKINAVYLAFRITDIASGISAMKALGISGASITIPFKETVMDFLDEVDKEAREIGAVNTVLNDGGTLSGFNTDCYGAVAPLKGVRIKGRRVGIVGAGGAARAVGFGIKKNGGRITIVNRSGATGETLAEALGADFLPLDRIADQTFDIIINTTPVGIAFDTDATPVPKHLLSREMVVMDIVYNPVETKLIKEAREMGCRTVDGLEMFVSQGAKQFEIWTGIRPSKEEIRSTVINGII